MNNVLLCGFMGCGKTTVGRIVAKRLSMQYLDLDCEIEKLAGCKIPTIFSRDGENVFRALEHQAICKLSQEEGFVVSTGGGTMTFQRNVAAVDSSDTILFLDASFENCYKRIKDSDRPLVRTNTKAYLKELFEKRRQSYLSAAAIRVIADDKRSEVANSVISSIKPRINKT